MSSRKQQVHIFVISKRVAPQIGNFRPHKGLRMGLFANSLEQRKESYRTMFYADLFEEFEIERIHPKY